MTLSQFLALCGVGIVSLGGGAGITLAILKWSGSVLADQIAEATKHRHAADIGVRARREQRAREPAHDLTPLEMRRGCDGLLYGQPRPQRLCEWLAVVDA